MWSNIALIGLVLLIAGCASNSNESRPIDPKVAGTYPTNYKQLVRENVRKTFFDPYSLRDVAISEPQPGRLLLQTTGPGWIVCLEANAKNKMGGYVGLRRTAFLIIEGEIRASESESFVSDEICKKYTLSPVDLMAESHPPAAPRNSNPKR